MAEAIFSNIQLGEESLMSIQSSYPDHKCGKCGINIKKGDAINKIDATGQWCSNENCPNPAKEVLHVRGIAGDFDYTIFDYTGGLVIKHHSTEQSISVNQLSEGVYLIRIQKEGRIYQSRFVIMK